MLITAFHKTTITGGAKRIAFPANGSVWINAGNYSYRVSRTEATKGTIQQYDEINGTPQRPLRQFDGLLTVRSSDDSTYAKAIAEPEKKLFGVQLSGNDVIIATDTALEAFALENQPAQEEQAAPVPSSSVGRFAINEPPRDFPLEIGESITLRAENTQDFQITRTVGGIRVKAKDPYGSEQTEYFPSNRPVTLGRADANSQSITGPSAFKIAASTNVSQDHFRVNLSNEILQVTFLPKQIRAGSTVASIIQRVPAKFRFEAGSRRYMAYVDTTSRHLQVSEDRRDDIETNIFTFIRSGETEHPLYASPVTVGFFIVNGEYFVSFSHSGAPIQISVQKTSAEDSAMLTRTAIERLARSLITTARGQSTAVRAQLQNLKAYVAQVRALARTRQLSLRSAYTFVATKAKGMGPAFDAAVNRQLDRALERFFRELEYKDQDPTIPAVWTDNARRLTGYTTTIYPGKPFSFTVTRLDGRTASFTLNGSKEGFYLLPDGRKPGEAVRGYSLKPGGETSKLDGGISVTIGNARGLFNKSYPLLVSGPEGTSVDFATKSDANNTKLTNGGIDMNAAKLNMQIKRDGNGVPLPVNQQNIENIQIDGLVPQVLKITPVTSLPMLAQ